MDEFKVIFKRLESIGTPDSIDSYAIFTVIIAADGFEYRENSGGVYPPGYFFYAVEDGVKKDMQGFFPADNILCIYNSYMTP